MFKNLRLLIAICSSLLTFGCANWPVDWPTSSAIHCSKTKEYLTYIQTSSGFVPYCRARSSEESLNAGASDKVKPEDSAESITEDGS